MSTEMFYVQMHIHTSESSRCGRATGAEMARACKAAGYSLMVTTDHFMNANINCDRDLPWEQKIEILFRGYYAAKEEGKRIGLTVLPGWETNNGGPEYLTYGLTEEFLLDNPDIADVSAAEYLRRVRLAGGFVVQAHPFRRAAYIPDFTPDPTVVEAFEVFNFCNKSPEFDEQARKMARQYGLIMTAGSDAHTTDKVSGGAMLFPEPIYTMPDFIAAVRQNRFRLMPQPLCGA